MQEGCRIIKDRLKLASLTHLHRLRAECNEGISGSPPQPQSCSQPFIQGDHVGTRKDQGLAPSPALPWPLDSLGEPAHLPHLRQDTRRPAHFSGLMHAPVQTSHKAESAMRMVTVVKRQAGAGEGAGVAQQSWVRIPTFPHRYLFTYLKRHLFQKSCFKWLQHYRSCVLLDTN